MDDSISIGHQSGVAVAAVFLLDYLKRANWFPIISENTETLNRLVSLAIAFSTAAGLSWAGDSAHGWTINIPPLAIVVDTLLHGAAQFGGQEILHKLLGNHAMNKDLLAKVNLIVDSLPKALLPGTGPVQGKVE